MTFLKNVSIYQQELYDDLKKLHPSVTDELVNASVLADLQSKQLHPAVRLSLRLSVQNNVIIKYNNNIIKKKII